MALLSFRCYCMSYGVAPVRRIWRLCLYTFGYDVDCKLSVAHLLLSVGFSSRVTSRYIIFIALQDKYFIVLYRVLCGMTNFWTIINYFKSIVGSYDNGKYFVLIFWKIMYNTEFLILAFMMCVWRLHVMCNIYIYLRLDRNIIGQLWSMCRCSNPYLGSGLRRLRVLPSVDWWM
jgi:hypothetical protein